MTQAYLDVVRGRRRASRARRRTRALGAFLAAAAVTGALASFWPQARAASDGTYLDRLDSTSYGNSNGTLSWSSPWVEIGESDGPGIGFVAFESIRCSSGTCLWFDDDLPGTVIGARRSADLTGAGGAVLTFSYQREQDVSSIATDFFVEVSSTASGPWTRLATYAISTTDTAPRIGAFDVTPFISATTTVRFVSNGAGTDNELYLDDVQIEAVPSGALHPHLWFSIRDDTSSGPAALPVVSDGTIASFADPGIEYEPGITAGTLGIRADWDAAFTGLDIAGLHLVSASMTVGGVGLQPGDLLFNLDGDGSLPNPDGSSLGFSKNDVGRFRPTTPGDYTDGTFAILLDNPLGAELRGVTLVERTTRVGEVTLNPGTLLLIRAGAGEHQDVWRYIVSSAGEGTTSGSTSRLINGEDIGFTSQIWGIELVEDGMGWPFPQGAIVLTIEQDTLLGVDGVAVPKRTLVSLVVGRTSLSASARVQAILAWDGNDLGFDADPERVDGFTFADLDLPPTFDLDQGDRTDPEGTPVSFSATATDPVGEPLVYSATNLPPGVSISPTTGQVSGTVDHTAAAGSAYAVTLRATDPGGKQATDTFTWTVTDVNRAPQMTAPADQASAEGQAISLAVGGFDPDGDTVTWSATGLPPGLSIAPASGVISGTISYDASPGSPYSVTVRLTDDGSPTLWTEVGLQWTVSNTNRAPVVTDPGNQASAEGAVVSLAIDAVDPDGDGLTWVGFGLPPGLAIDPVTGVITGTVPYDASPSSPYATTIRVFDDPGLWTEVAFTWTVADTNRAPVVVDPGDRSNAEGDPVTFGIAGSDPDGDPLTWSAAGLPDGLAIDPSTGVISGTLTYDAAGVHAVTVRATDDGTPSLFDEVGFTWTVAGTNRPPQVTDPGDQSGAEGETVSLAITGTDPDLDTITWSAGGLPAGLTIDPASGVIGGTLSYDASPTSPYTVTVRATDDGVPDLFAEVVFTWTVADTNRAPVVTSPGDRSNSEGDPVAFAVPGTDADGDGLTWSATDLPPGLAIDPVSGVISGAIDFNASAGSPYSVTVRATDDGSPTLFDEVAFTWTVADTNRSPVVLDPGGQGDAEGDPVSLTVIGSDPDLDPLQWSATGLPPGLVIDLSSGVISGTLDFDASVGSPHAVTVRATDGGGLFDEVAFAWTVANTNRAPVVANPGNRSGAEGDTVSLPLSGSDPDGESLTWSAVGLPQGLAIDPGTAVISGSIGYDASPGSPHAVTVRATDSGSPSLFTEVSFTWSVADTNRAPVVADPGARNDAEGDTISLAMSGSDPDLDALTWSATGLPAGLSIAPSTGLVSGTIGYEAAPGSPYSVTVRATDGGGLFDEVTFSWSVADTNRPPAVTTPGDQAAAEGDPVSLAVPATDPDGDGLTWSATGLPGGLAIDPATGTITGTVSYVASGNHAVTVRVTDDGSPVRFTEVSFTWSVANTNRPPIVVTPVDQTSAEGAFLSLPISGSDPDGNAITWSATGLPAGLSIDPSTGTIAGTLSYTSAGSHPVTVRVTDNGSPVLFTEVSFMWSVTNTNRPPVVTNLGPQNDAEGAAISMPVPGSDPDGDTLTWSASGLPGGLTMAPATGIISGTLSFTSAGVHTVTVRATDNGSPVLITEVTFTWTVSNTNRAPTVFDPGTVTRAEGDTVSLVIAASDPDGEAITFAASGLPPGLSIDATTGLISGNLGYALGDQYTAIVTVTDAGSPSLQSSVTFDWIIADVNRPPVVTAIPNRTTEQGAATSITAAATDPDGDAVTWSATGLPGGVTIAGTTGVVSGTPAAPGVYGVTVTATDAGSPPLTGSAAFTWTVVSPPGFPVIAEIASRQDRDGDPISFMASAEHPDGLAITWSAVDLPNGVRLDAASGRIAGILDSEGTWFTRITVTDTRGQTATASFVWIVESAEDLAPVTGKDVIRVAIDDVGPGGIALDAAGNDIDPEGGTVRIVSVGPATVGTVELVDSMVVFHPPSGWLGTTSIPYSVADPAGNRSDGVIQITVEDSLENRLGTAALTVPAGPGVVDLGTLAALTPAAGTEVLLGSVFQSLYVLRVPLALLGGAVFWSLLLGGILNLGFVLRGGIPRLVRRTSRHVAVVLVAHGGRVEALSEPGRGEVLDRLTATERGIEATGRRVIDGEGAEWAEIRIEAGLGWVLSYHLTEEVDRAGFAADPEVRHLTEEFIARLRARRDFADLVSQHGLFVAHHAPLVHFPPERLHGLMDDPTRRVWKGRNPAYPDFSGTFDLAVATGVLDAVDHPQREIVHDAPAVPSTVIPVEFTNFHFVSVGADLHGPDRLDQSAWLVMISYEAARPRIIGLVREG